MDWHDYGLVAARGLAPRKHAHSISCQELLLRPFAVCAQPLTLNTMLFAAIQFGCAGLRRYGRSARVTRLWSL
jgi:hypothetical protein